ncbi:MAG: endonuclease/exonuclease/phosphatase family protein [Myxococcales bacterium]|nr:endonuclease/exonuclease/phosphatase family protein [Myxococcales bacterium]
MQIPDRRLGGRCRAGWLRALAVLSALPMLTGCPDRLRVLSSQGASVRLKANASSQTDAARSHQLRVLTFNAGLAPGVIPHVDDRATSIATALAQEDFDVACLQEVWLQRHQRLLRDQLTREPGVTWMSPEPEPVAGLRCEDAELTSLVACVAKNCREESNVASCAIERCRSRLDGLSDGCAACLSRDLDDPLRSLASCVEASDAVGDAGLTPKPYLLGGSYGTALISRLPVLDVEYTQFESTMHPRGVIHARVEHPSLGEVDAYCTHLTPFLRGMKHPPAGEFIREQSGQIEQLIRMIGAPGEQRGNRPLLLLGDLNTGPHVAQGESYQARLPQHFARLLVGTGLRDAAPAQAKDCTFCYGNPLQPHPDSGGLRIDHVLFRQLEPRTVRYERAFVEPTLSDHYGVRVLLQL